MLNIRKIVLVLCFVLFTNSAFSDEPVRKIKRVESLKAKHLHIFKEIQDAFDSEDHARVETLLNCLSLEIRTSEKVEDYRFHTLISEGNISEAERVAEKLLERGDLHIMDRARIHNALGNAYYANDNLEGALAEYKKIIELREN